MPNLAERTIDLLTDHINLHSDRNAAEYNECDKDLCDWCDQAKGLIEDIRRDQEQPTTPLTRSVPELVDAINTTRSELRFQIERLKNTRGESPEQSEYFRKLILRYLRAQPALDLLYGYHKSRVERHASTGQSAPLQSADPQSISREGKAAAYVSDPRD